MAARHDDRAGGGEHTPDAAADRDLGAGDLSGGGTAHLAHAPPAIHPGMHVREAAAIRYGLKNLGFAPGGEDVVWNRCDLAVRHGIWRRSAIHPLETLVFGDRNGRFGIMTARALLLGTVPHPNVLGAHPQHPRERLPRVGPVPHQRL
jgi:hypothetical protein